MKNWKDFHGPNAGYILELYDRYQQEPASVDEATRAYFNQWSPPPDGYGEGAVAETAAQVDKIVGVVNLAQAIREYGHLAAQLDPLGGEPLGDPWLDMAAYNLTEADLDRLPAGLIGGPIAGTAGTAREAIHRLRAVYSGKTGYDYDHLRLPEEREWLRDAAEAERFCFPNDPIDPKALLKRLTQIETFEHFLHRSFPGKTRFSIEGLDMLVPMLDEIIGAAAEEGLYTILLGMTHRGRLNVLAHILNKPYSQILAEFKEPLKGQGYFIRDELGWTGDVKYHLGARRALRDGETVDLEVRMPPNPSHLEAINPVIQGMARAAGTYTDEGGPPCFDHPVSLPILIHGDAGFPGQGVVAETLNLARLSGYQTGGTIHIIVNNQLGYTTLPERGRSMLYASDLAKGFKIPIVHVNADDPEACTEAARLATAYRTKFGKDFLIDLIGYRRYGHNEGDEPSFTQPRLYEKISNHPTVREQWAETLQERGLIEADEAEEMVQEQLALLQETLDNLEPAKEISQEQPKLSPAGAARRVETAVPLEKLGRLNEALLQTPEEFNLHHKLERPMKRRRQAFAGPDEAAVDWATAESLALASILADGVAIRMTGQDVERGTFSQRHAVFHDVETGEAFIPLQAIPQARAAFEIHNSPLTENAAIGFEFGYNVQEPGRLVIWEAQYGDFINNAQTVIDEFVTSARSKWGQTPSLVLLLPHGYEGQGPDHSTGRPERFLQMAAETNMRVANCTTAAQYFHLLRRQAALLETDPLPLIVMTPKSLLRHPKVASSPKELAEGRWQPVIDDPQAPHRADQITCLLLCSGKVYVDLITDDRYEDSSSIAIARIEQLYPFPEADLKPVFDRYPNLEEIVWLQEEPKNMGPWRYLQPHLSRMLEGRRPLHYLGRPLASSPAEGSSAWHAANQKSLLDQAYSMDRGMKEEDIIVWEKYL